MFRVVEQAFVGTDTKNGCAGGYEQAFVGRDHRTDTKNGCAGGYLRISTMNIYKLPLTGQVTGLPLLKAEPLKFTQFRIRPYCKVS